MVPSEGESTIAKAFGLDAATHRIGDRGDEVLIGNGRDSVRIVTLAQWQFHDEDSGAIRLTVRSSR